MRRCLGFVVGVVCATGLLASEQMPDRLLHDGKEYVISVNPLEPYFKKHPKRHPSDFRDYTKGITLSSGLTRGYIATFEIVDDELFVRDIVVLAGWDEATKENICESVMRKVFPDDAEVKADWVTGFLAAVGCGDFGSRESDGVAGVWEDRTVFEFRAGELVSKWLMAPHTYWCFVRMDEYRAVRDRMKKEGYTNTYCWRDPDNWNETRKGTRISTGGWNLAIGWVIR